MWARLVQEACPAADDAWRRAGLLKARVVGRRDAEFFAAMRVIPRTLEERGDSLNALVRHPVDGLDLPAQRSRPVLAIGPHLQQRVEDCGIAAARRFELLVPPRSERLRLPVGGARIKRRFDLAEQVDARAPGARDVLPIF